MAAKKSTGGQKKVSNVSTNKASSRSLKTVVERSGTGRSGGKGAKTGSKVSKPSASEGLKAKAIVTKSTASKGTISKSTISKSATTETGGKVAVKVGGKVGQQPGSKATTSSAKPAAKSGEAVKASPSKTAKAAKPTRKSQPKAERLVSKDNTTAAEARRLLGVGDTVPQFEALDQNGQKISNREWASAPYVLYFYPKDDTPGCTTQACGFRDELPAFEELGVKVVGCSPDSPNAHTRFAAKYGLQFTLLADIEKDLSQLFGVWKLKQNYGREYMGVERSTFLIDKNGKIARQWRGVRVAGHVPEVLQAVRELG